MSRTDPSSAVRKSTRHRRVSNALLVLVVCLWIAAPVIAVVAIFSRLDATRLVAARDVWVPVGAATGERRNPVTLYLSWESDEALVAPAWSGTVTDVFVAAGSTLNSGDPILALDGTKRIAAALTSPLYRPVLPSTRGEDVASLTSFLANRGVDINPSDRLTRSSWREITAWVGGLGVDVSNGLTAFDPGWLVYLPREAVRLAEVDVPIGAPAPAAGTALATLESTVVGAQILDPQRLEGAESNDDTPLDELQLEAAAAQVPAGSRLLLGASELQLDDARQNVAVQSLPEVERLVLAGAMMSTAVVETTNDELAMTVPVSAIVDGRCVIREGTDRRPEPAPITLVQTEGGVATVRATFSAGDRVLANPDIHESSCN